MKRSDRYQEPPEFDRSKVDFSRFHPFDHSVFSAECLEYYGGRRNHLLGKWRYVWSNELRRETFCRVGRHRGRQWTKLQNGKPFKTWVACADCGTQMSKPQMV